MVKNNKKESKEVYATFSQRWIAYLRDQFIYLIIYLIGMLGISILIYIFTSIFTAEAKTLFDFQENLFMVLVLGIYLIGKWLYFAIMESSNRQATFAKEQEEIKVTDLNGNKISFLRASVRHFSSVLSIMTFNFGFLMASFTKRKQTLHDLMSGCLVVKNNLKQK